MTFTSLLKIPSANIPLVMSGAAYLLIIAVLSTVGITQSEDEGAPARIFQLLILLQMPIVAFFALKWLPRNPRPAALILLLQVAAATLAVVTIFIIEKAAAV